MCLNKVRIQYVKKLFSLPKVKAGADRSTDLGDAGEKGRSYPLKCFQFQTIKCRDKTFCPNGDCVNIVVKRNFRELQFT